LFREAEEPKRILRGSAKLFHSGLRQIVRPGWGRGLQEPVLEIRSLRPGERTVAGSCFREHGLRTRACRFIYPSGGTGWAGHNNCSSALIGGYGYLSVKWEQTQKFAPILFFIVSGSLPPPFQGLHPAGTRQTHTLPVARKSRRLWPVR
jgi:hypothetical protein